jgi:hypothetical protein
MRLLLIGLAALAASACMVSRVPLQAELAPFTGAARTYKLAAPVTVRANASADQILRANTRWAQIGSIPQGDVFETKDQVVIVNSFSVFEANLVVKDGKVVGYFIPVGCSFVAATPVAISFTTEDGQ